MRSLVLLVPMSVAIALVGFARADQPGPGKDAAKETPTYTCPMHPKVQSAKPDSCPVCKMKLQVKQLAAAKTGPAPVDSMTEHDPAVMDHFAMEPAGMDAMGMGMEGMNCPMCKGMMGMSMGGSAADATAKVAKPLAPAGYQRSAGRRCGGGC